MALAEPIHTDDLTERILVVRQAPSLRALAPAARAAVASMLRERQFRAGEVIANDGDPSDSLLIVVEGRVRLSRKGKFWRMLEAPGAIGFIAMLARAGASGAVAETDVRGFELSREAMEEVFEDHGAVLLDTIRVVAASLLHEMKTRPPPGTPLAISSHDPAFRDPGRALDLVDRIFFLRKMRAFASSNVNALAELSQRVVEKRFAAGDVVWRPGQDADHVLMLVSGKIELHHPSGVVQPFSAGSPIGGVESLAGDKRWNTLRIVEPVLALAGYREVMLDIFEDNHDVGLDFLATIATALLRFWDEGATESASANSEMAPQPPAP